MIRTAAVVSALYLAVAHAQQVGTLEAEVHPSLPAQQCTASGCTNVNTKIVLDSNWRWVHTTSGYANCYDGNSWDTALCPNGSTCASQCALEGANYASTYGITASGNSLSLKFVTGANIGSRVYLLRDDTHYQMFTLLNGEFTFDVDMSTLGCGLNGALYLSQMDEDGGMARFPANKAGAKYGTGYCDAQCPHDIKFINGEANVEGWNPSETDPNAGSGRYGTCCDEMDIWEANSLSTAYTPHPCSPDAPYRCDGLECGDGADRYSSVCDKDGCDFNSWRMGNKEFLGPGKTIDTTRKFTVVTQFITSDGTANGDLTEIRRKYVQDGVVYENSQSNVPGITATNSITDAFCAQQKTAFGDNNKFATEGGLKAMGASLKKGMVLSLSIWADHAAHMLWLDSNYPLDKDPSTPGVSRGPCATTTGDPDDVVSEQGNATIKFSNIKWGTLGSTFSGSTGTSSTRTGASTSATTRTSTSTNPTTSTVPQWGQCGGVNHTGSTVCAAPYTCHKINDFYSQCY